MILTKVQPPLLELPACCRGCSADSGRDWFLDLGYMEDYWGKVYYCNLCFAELATAAGYLSETRLNEAREEYMTTLEEFKSASFEVMGAIDVLKSGGFDVLALYGWIRSLAHGETTVEFPVRAQRVVTGKKRTSKSGDESGPDDVPVPQLDI